jgi:hypothetical protein
VGQSGSIADGRNPTALFAVQGRGKKGQKKYTMFFKPT